MMNWIMNKVLNPGSDEVTKALLTQDYPNNPFEIVTAAEKMTPRAILEACIRANKGHDLYRPFGSPVVLSPWEKILLNPKQLFYLPMTSVSEVDTSVTIGPRARKPLRLDIPIMITGMSYGGSLSLKMKMALAKGSAMAGTSTNTGESAVSPEERQMAKYIVGQYNRGGFLMRPEQLKQVDAIEVQLGQGAYGGAVESSMKAEMIDEHLRTTLGLKQGQDMVINARMPGVTTTQDIINLVNALKRGHDVPVGVKISGSDYIEEELEVIARTDADFIAVDGSEGGTAVAPPTLEDNIGLPTLHTLVRTVDWLEEQGERDRFSVIAAGGLSTPGHFLKALAIGADAVYIGSIAVFAAINTQVTAVLPQHVPAQLALYMGKEKDKLDVDKAAQSLHNFLMSCREEMVLACQAMGKTRMGDLSREDLVTVDKDLAEFMGIRYAASPRRARVGLTV
ncbi:MAG: FMN-binding glutamate synthase family protein [Bacillota bacterium]